MHNAILNFASLVWQADKTASDYWGYVSSGLVLIAAVYAVWLWGRGIAPVLVRLGSGLSRRKIAIFAKGDMAESIAELLKDSALFRPVNIVPIRNEGDFGKAETATIFIVHWPDWTATMNQILACKNDKTALVVYAPPGNVIPQNIMASINDTRNASIVNLRGRLMNDVILGMITTSYEKSRN